jgi:hypothetical protein
VWRRPWDETCGEPVSRQALPSARLNEVSDGGRPVEVCSSQRPMKGRASSSRSARCGSSGVGPPVSDQALERGDDQLGELEDAAPVVLGRADRVAVRREAPADVHDAGGEIDIVAGETGHLPEPGPEGELQQRGVTLPALQCRQDRSGVVAFEDRLVVTLPAGPVLLRADRRAVRAQPVGGGRAEQRRCGAVDPLGERGRPLGDHAVEQPGDVGRGDLADPGVVRGRIELPTPRFSVVCSTN